jgi:hypothetical protein
MLPEYACQVVHLGTKKNEFHIDHLNNQTNLAFAFPLLLDSSHKHCNNMLQENHLDLRQDYMPHEVFVVLVYEVNNKDNSLIDKNIQHTCWTYLNHRPVQHFDQINNRNNTNQVNRWECLQNIRIIQLKEIR